jgi:hypothetical protein
VERRCVPHLEGGSEPLGGAVGGALVAGVDDGERPASGADVLAQSGDLGQSDGVVDRLVLAAAPAAQLEDRDADLADVHGLHGPSARGWTGARVGRCGQVPVGLLEQVGGPAERGGHRGEALGGGAGAQRLLGPSAPLGRRRRGRPARASPQSASVTSSGAARLAGSVSAAIDSATSSALPAVGRAPGPCR